MDDLRETLNELRLLIGVTRQVDYSLEENDAFGKMADEHIELPEGTFQDPHDPIRFYHIEKSDLTQAEVYELLLIRQAQHLHSIRSWVSFFGILIIIALSLTIVLILTGGFHILFR
jgi:hypothetical protein